MTRPKKDPLSFVKYRLERLEADFAKASEDFMWKTKEGGGVRNIHMGDNIKALLFLYNDIAAHYDLLHSVDPK